MKKTLPFYSRVFYACLVQSSLSLLNNSCESSAVLDSQLGQALAVHLDTSLLDAVHELGVVQAVVLVR